MVVSESDRRESSEGKVRQRRQSPYCTHILKFKVGDKSLRKILGLDTLIHRYILLIQWNAWVILLISLWPIDIVSLLKLADDHPKYSERVTWYEYDDYKPKSLQDVFDNKYVTNVVVCLRQDHVVSGFWITRYEFRKILLSSLLNKIHDDWHVIALECID